MVRETVVRDPQLAAPEGPAQRYARTTSAVAATGSQTAIR
jgi:hypothetical protein